MDFMYLYENVKKNILIKSNVISVYDRFNKTAKNVKTIDNKRALRFIKFYNRTRERVKNKKIPQYRISLKIKTLVFVFVNTRLLQRAERTR